MVLAALVAAILMLVGGRASGGSAVPGVHTQLQSVTSLAPSVPHLPTPSVPSVPSLPSVPSVPTPSVPSVPSAPSVPGVGAPSVPGVPSSGVPVAGGGVVPGVGGAGTSAGPGAVGAGEGGSSAGGRRSGKSGATGRHARVCAASASERRHNRAVRERNLRRDVDRFSGCLDALPGVEGPLLAIRAGIGAAEPASLTEAARRLGISTSRAVRIERRGLRHLRAVGRSGACSSGAAAARRGVALGTGPGAIPQLQPPVLLASRPSLTSVVALGGSSHSRGERGKRSLAIVPPAGTGQATESRAPATVRATEASSKTASYIAALAVLTLLLAALVMAWRRRGQSGPGRLAEQTGSAAVWWPPGHGEVPTGPAEPPLVAAEAVAPPVSRPADQGLGADSGNEGEASAAEAGSGGSATAASYGGTLAASGGVASHAAPAEPAPSAPAAPAARRRPRPAVVAASLVSLGVALLRSRRRR